MRTFEGFMLNISEVLLSRSMRDRLLLLVLLVTTIVVSALPKISFVLYPILHQASLVVAVDRSKFKSCSQSGFCKRCRAVQPGVSTYQVKQKGEYYNGCIQTSFPGGSNVPAHHSHAIRGSNHRYSNR